MKGYAALLASAWWALGSTGCSPAPERAADRGPAFRRVGRFVPPDSGSIEIVAVDSSSTRVVYVDSHRDRVGIVDVTSPAQPVLVDELVLDATPTSVSVLDEVAIVVARTTRFRVGEAPERRPGQLILLDLETGRVVGTLPIGEGPDSVATGRIGGVPIAIVAVENEPVLVDNDGRYVEGDEPGQPNDVSAPGHIEVVSLAWDPPVSRRIALSESVMRAAHCLFPYDPQPEFVSLSPSGERAAVTLQENNCVAVLDLSTPLAPQLQSLFTLGRVPNRATDVENDGRIAFSTRYPDDVLAREPLSGTRMPDAVAWNTTGTVLYTADEGEPDLTGGRGFSAWSPDGELLWDDAGALEARAAAEGLYRDETSDARGIEIEGLATGVFQGRELLFASAERGAFVAVYDLSEPERPEFVELLLTDEGPEGLVPVPRRNLLLAGNEGRSHHGGSLSIFVVDESFAAATAARLDPSTERRRP